MREKQLEYRGIAPKPEPGHSILYPKRDGHWYFKNKDGVEHRVIDGSSADQPMRGNPVLSSASGAGIKLDITSPAFGFRDITGEVLTRGVGASDPAWAQVGSGPFYAYQFAINDVCWMVYHVPHDYAPGTDVFFHAHWIPDGTDANSVKWNWNYMYAKGHDQGAFAPAGASITAEQAQGSPPEAYRHMVTETAAVTIAGCEPDGLIYVKITRQTNGGVDNADAIFLLTADVHYQSTNLATQNRSPDFYG